MSLSIEQALDKIYEALKGATTDGQGSIEYSLTKIAETLETGSNVNLPAVTATDNGDVLTVVEGNWSKADIPSQLPAVTGSDNGNVLTVVEGSWAKAAPSGGGNDFRVTISYDSTNESYASDKTFAEISEAVEAGNNVYAVLSYDTIDTYIIPLYMHISGDYGYAVFSRVYVMDDEGMRIGYTTITINYSDNVYESGSSKPWNSI